MTLRNPTPSDAVLVAIDVAKGRNEVLIDVPGRQRRQRLSVLNARPEHDRLIALLIWFFAFLERFPTPASITALSKEAFIAAAWDVAGRKVAKGKLLGDIYETART